jgi:hypothetical protein
LDVQGDAYTAEQVVELKAKLLRMPLKEVEEFYKTAYRNCQYVGIKPIDAAFIQMLVTAWKVLTIRANEKSR